MKTLLLRRRIPDKEKRAIFLADQKVMKKVTADLKRIGKQLRFLLPKIQSVRSFDNKQVAQVSKFIDEYDDFCSNLWDEFKSKCDPEEW